LGLIKNGFIVDKFDLNWTQEDVIEMSFDIKTKKEYDLVTNEIDKKPQLHWKCYNCDLKLNHYMCFINEMTLCTDCFEDSYCCDCWEFKNNTNENRICDDCI
jgi:hypothetical protein